MKISILNFRKHIWRKTALALFAFAFFCPVSPVHADELNDMEQKSSNLKEELGGIHQDILDITSQMAEVEYEIESTDGEIEKTKEQLLIAANKEQEQYEDMKLRIQYMYENGAAYTFEFLAGATDMPDLLNKMDSVQELSAYDQERLEELKSLQATIAEQEQHLSKEQESNKKLKKELESKKEELQVKAEETSTDLDSISGQIQEYKAEQKRIAEEKRLAEEAEAARKAEEERAKKAAEKAQSQGKAASESPAKEPAGNKASSGTASAGKNTVSGTKSEGKDTSSGTGSSGKNTSSGTKSEDKKGSSSSSDKSQSSSNKKKPSSSYKPASGKNVLTKSKGVVYYNGHKETYYSQRVLPGKGLKIPGRHVAADGTIRDKDNYICVASSDYKKGTVVQTSLGTGKVYDCGCASGTIDIYTDW